MDAFVLCKAKTPLGVATVYGKHFAVLGKYGIV